MTLVDRIAGELADFHWSGLADDREVRAMAERALACVVPELDRLRRIEAAARDYRFAHPCEDPEFCEAYAALKAALEASTDV